MAWKDIGCDLLSAVTVLPYNLSKVLHHLLSLLLSLPFNSAFRLAVLWRRNYLLWSPLVHSVLLSVVPGRPTIIITWRQDACGCNITLFRLISSILSVKSLSIIGESMCATKTAEINPNYSPLPAQFSCENRGQGTWGVPNMGGGHCKLLLLGTCYCPIRKCLCYAKQEIQQYLCQQY